MSCKVFAIQNEKGGVGKTTTTVSLVHAFADMGKKVLVIDNDPSHDATTILCGEEIPAAIHGATDRLGPSNTFHLYDNKVEVVPYPISDSIGLIGSSDRLSLLGSADFNQLFTFSDNVEKFTSDFDIIMIDGPPSFSTPFTASVLASESGGVLIPVLLDDLSFEAARKVVARINTMNKRMNVSIPVLGLLPSQVANNPLPQSAKMYLDDMHNEFDGNVFNTHIHRTVKISNAIAARLPLNVNNKDERKAAQQFIDLAAELFNKLSQ